jgi:H+/Cl- antiporter ClcA
MSNNHLGDFTATRRMVLLTGIAIVIGVIASFVALALLKLIALFTNIFYYQTLSFAPSSPANHTLGTLAVVVPIIGAFFIGLMARYGSDRIRGHGIPEALEAILTNGSKVSPKVAILKPLSSAVSIGSGGPFGAEGPIIMTGGAVGSIIAQLISLTSAERKTLLVAGAAAGMSATFATPLAAILLAVELMLFEWKPRSFVPVALASATAAIARPFILGAGPLFAVAPHANVLGLPVLVCCIIVGLAAGALSAALTYAVYAAEDFFERLPIHWMWWPMFGGLAIGLGGLIAPRALGVGYDVIGDLLDERMVTATVLTLVIVKGLIWSISLGSGTSGGVLAPLLIMGSALGALFAHVLPDGGLGFWPLVGLGAILGGTMRSPLTGIVFAVELTHDMNMFLPLVIAVTMAHAFTVLTLKRSILTEKLARRGFHVSREYAIDELEVLFARDAMQSDIVVLPQTATVGDLIARVGTGPREDRSQRLFPIVDEDACLVGTITFAVMREHADAPETPVIDLADRAPNQMLSNQTLRMGVEHMAVLGITRLLVMNPNDPTKLVGKLALHDILKARNQHLQDEQRRERVLPWEYLTAAIFRRRSDRSESATSSPRS